jgi:hypothetical protein
VTFLAAGWSSLVARRAHNPKVAGSNPAPATIHGLFTSDSRASERIRTFPDQLFAIRLGSYPQVYRGICRGLLKTALCAHAGVAPVKRLRSSDFACLAITLRGLRTATTQAPAQSAFLPQVCNRVSDRGRGRLRASRGPHLSGRSANDDRPVAISSAARRTSAITASRTSSEGRPSKAFRDIDPN